MARALSILALVAAVISTTGCALPQQFERHIIELHGAVIVQASRYAGREENLVDDLWIDLAKAPPFQFRFPDGSWVNSNDINLGTLVRYELRMDKYGDFSYATWHPDMSILASAVGRHQFFQFRIENNDRVSALSLGTCGAAFQEVLRTMDGVSFGFPMQVKDVERLFGPVTRVERVAIVTGFSCF